MSKQDELVGIYQGLLAAVDIYPDENGLLYYRPPGGPVGPDGQPIPQPALLDGKHWVLPTREVLRESPWEEKVAFHPLSEQIINTDPITLTKLKSLVNIKLNTMLGAIMLSLTEFAASKDQNTSAKVGAKASKYRQLVPNIKEVSLKQMKEIIKRLSMDSARRFVNIYIQRNTGSLEGRQRLRMASVNFPVRVELDNEDRKVFGVQLSQKDQESFKTLFDFILPDNDNLETYSAASDSSAGPSFQALAEAFFKVASRLNEVIHTHRKIIPEYESLMVDLSWAEHLPKLEKLSVAIPPLPGNIGEPIRSSSNQGALSDTTAAQRKPAVANPKGSALGGSPLGRYSEAKEETNTRSSAADASKKSISELLREQREAESRVTAFGGSRFGRVSSFGSGNQYGGRAREPEVPDWAKSDDYTKQTIGGVVPEDRVGSLSSRFGGRGFGGGNRGGDFGRPSGGSRFNR